MRLLLDTHIFLWYISGDSRLVSYDRDTISDPSSAVFLSVVSIWEAIIKYRLGNLPLPSPPEIYLPQQRVKHNIGILTLEEASVTRLSQLPLLHRDPFDRMLLCQAQEHGLTLVTADHALKVYGISTL